MSIVFGISFILFSCQSSNKKAEYESETESENISPELSLKIDRFEIDLFSTPVDSVKEQIPNLKSKYGEFFDIFTYKIINIGSSDKKDFPKYLKSFITDKYMYITYDRVKKTYPDFNTPGSELEEGFKNYKLLFPDKTIPHIYTMISGFNQSIVTADTILGISLDKYLGRSCEFYENLGLPQYQRRTMEREFIATDALRGWCYSEFSYNDSAENLLTNILYEGKIIYLLKELFPETPDSIILGYTANQLKWCKVNQKEMWTFLIERKLIFSIDYMTINKLINPAPFTSFFTTESPGKAVVWLGYGIIDAYMRNNKLTISQLMLNSNYQGILEQSKFQP